MNFTFKNKKIRKVFQQSLLIAVCSTLPIFGVFAETSVSSEKQSLTSEEIQKAFQKASENFGSNSTEPVEKNTPTKKPSSNIKLEWSEKKETKKSRKNLNNSKQLDVSIISNDAIMMQEKAKDHQYIELKDVHLAVDMDNKSIRKVVDEIIDLASNKTGPWKVKWRLHKEHKYLLDEKVNLTAESSFNDFISYLIDRINNMTGIQLFVTSFNTSRIIVISDTHY